MYYVCNACNICMYVMYVCMVCLCVYFIISKYKMVQLRQLAPPCPAMSSDCVLY